MKKILSMILVLSMLLTASAALAEDLGIQAIGKENAAESSSVVDMQIGCSYKLNGCAVVEVKEFHFVDCFAQFGETENYSVWQPHTWVTDADKNMDIVYCHSDSYMQRKSWRYADASWMDSGSDAEFVWFVVHVTNLQKDEVDFTKTTSVKVVYENEYEFNGWIRQIDYDKLEKVYSDGGIARYNQEKGTYPAPVVLNPKFVTALKMMYGSTYVFGCTLPSYIVTDEESPLRIEIQMGENDLTYHIRK